MKKRSKSTWLTVYSGSKLSLFSPTFADGSSYTSISVVRFEVGCPSLDVYVLRCGRDIAIRPAQFFLLHVANIQFWDKLDNLFSVFIHRMNRMYSKSPKIGMLFDVRW